MNMGQGFTISKKFLPYTYNDRNIPGVGASATEKVGFVVFGLTHNFENNQWNTDVRANMIYLKKIEDFKGAAVKAKAENKEFSTNYANFLGVSLGKADINSLNQKEVWEKIAFNFIAKKESFISIPRPDQGTLRGGYGSDSIVSPTGEVTQVTANTKFTKEDANRTLIYRISQFAKTVKNQIGDSKWNDLKGNQKAALVSFAYNAGSLTKLVVSAIKLGSPQTVYNAIAAGPTTGQGSNAVIPGLVSRRKEEAALYLI